MSLPLTWKVVSLDEIATTASGGTPSRSRSSFYGGLIPWVKSGELRDGVIASTEESITEEGLANSSAKIFPKGTLCIALYGATVGKAGILNVDAATNQAVCGIFPSQGVAAKYLFYFLQSIRSQLIALSQGGAQPNISQAIIRNLNVPLAPPNEQLRIVSEIEKQLTRLDDAVAALKRAQANLKRYRASVLKAACEGRLVPTEAELSRKEGRSYEPASELLKRILAERRAKWEAHQLQKMMAIGKPPHNDEWKKKYREPKPLDTLNLPKLPQGWAWTTLETIAEAKLGKMLSRAAFHPNLVQMPYLRNENIQWEQINTNDIKSMGFEPDEMDRFAVHPGDLLVCEGGEAGRAAVYQGPADKFQYQKALHRIRPYGALTNAYFLQAYFAHFVPGGQVIPRRSETTIQHLPLEVLEKLPVPLPPKLEQDRIVAEFARVSSIIEDQFRSIVNTAMHASRLRDAVLKNAFQGKLVPQNPNDEPASVLLERIRAERASTAQPIKGEIAMSSNGKRHKSLS